MRRVIFFSLFLCSCFFSLAQGTGYIRLQGRQFIDQNGDPFYPVVMNYNVAIQLLPSGDFICAPAPDYGVDNNFQHSTLADCDQDIKNDFQKCLDLGFNTVRLFASAPFFYANWPIQGYQQFIDGSNILQYPASFSGVAFLSYKPSDWPPHKWQVLHPAITNDQNTNTLISLNLHILELAEEVGIKVILLTGQKDLWYPHGPIDGADFAADLYAEYLIRLATACSSNTALMAYDLINEPAYRENYMNENLTKHDVCELTGYWYDAIKSIDQNHLVTMGVSDIQTAFLWDPTIMKLDFVSPHIYPIETVFENSDPSPYYTGYSRTDAFERWKGQAYWFGQNMPLPWMIGETGFSGQDDLSDYEGNNELPCGGTFPPCTLCTGCDYTNSIYARPPWNFGTEAEQAAFAHNSQQAVWDYGGSGYSWWEFQNTGKRYDKMNNQNRPTAYQNYWGLFYRGVDHPYTGAQKPVASEFDGFFQLQPRVNTEPADYHDPYHHDTYNPSHTGSETGTVEDQDGNPIQDAVVGGWTLLNWGPNLLEGDFDDIYYYHYSFSDENGSFEIIPYDYDPLTNGNTNSIKGIQISATGASRYSSWGSFPVDGIYTLERISDFNTTVEGITISTTGNVYKGLNTLTASNVIVTSSGEADFKARKEVQVNSEFHAAAGSEVHIFTEAIFTDCPDISSYRIAGAHETNDDSYSATSIELKFKKYFLFEIYPNPSAGYFHINVFGNSENTEFELFNPVSERILGFTSSNHSFDLNLSAVPKGIYFLRANNTVQKLIIY